MEHGMMGPVGLWAITTLIGVAIMLYTARRVYKINQTGRVVTMPLMFAHLLVMSINEAIMVPWMLLGWSGLGWIALATVAAHAVICQRQAARADEF